MDIPAPTPDFSRLVAAREHDPFSLLGLHRDGAQWVVRMFDPYAESVALERDGATAPLARVHPAGVFEWRGAASPVLPYVLRVTAQGAARRVHDPYAFLPQAATDDLFLFNQGTNYQAYRLLGAHVQTRHDIAGVCFRVWAPNAGRVSVVGDFNRWDGRLHQMATLGASGTWELFIPDLAAGTLYKFEILNRDSGAVLVKTDPYAQSFELRPATAARVSAASQHAWSDAGWLTRRAQLDWLHAPLAIYEVHAGSWRRHPDGRCYTYRELAQHLVPYVRDMGYTHIELPSTILGDMVEFA